MGALELVSNRDTLEAIANADEECEKVRDLILLACCVGVQVRCRKITPQTARFDLYSFENPLE